MCAPGARVTHPLPSPAVNASLFRTRSAFRALAAVAALAVLPACGGGDGPTQTHTLSVTATGKLERGYTVTVAVSDAGAPLAEGAYTLTVQPADAGVVLGGGQVKLAKAGSVTINASANGIVGKTTLTVAAPPIVVFDRSVNGNRDIWRVDLDGQNLAQLTTDASEDQDPAVAQGKVVWISFRAGNGEVFSMPLAGGTSTRLTNTPTGESTPSLSADGTRLAYALEISGATKVFSANSDGSGAARVTPNDFGFDGVIETAPSWAGGNKLAFVATANGSADIFQGTPGAAPTLLAGGNTAEVEPAWSPDAATLAFVSNRGGTTEIYTLNVASGVVTQLTSGAGTKSQPAWTPDGRVVYLETLAGSRLRWVDPAQPTIVTTIDTGTGTVGHPAVAPAP